MIQLTPSESVTMLLLSIPKSLTAMSSVLLSCSTYILPSSYILTIISLSNVNGMSNILTSVLYGIIVSTYLAFSGLYP